MRRFELFPEVEGQHGLVPSFFRRHCGDEFFNAVQQAITSAPVLRCGDSACMQCGATSPMSFALAHYSPRLLDGGKWTKFDRGNGMCWMQFIADTDFELGYATGQPARTYSHLYLTKIAECDQLKLGLLLGQEVLHIRAGFSISPPSLVHLPLRWLESVGRYEIV